MQQWSNVIVAAKKSFEAERGITQPSYNITGPFRHLHIIHQSSRAMHALKILSNIETASMHLRYLLEVCVIVFCHSLLLIRDM
jgi:hypothetical protein